MNTEAILEGILFIQGDEGLTIKQIKNILEIENEELIKAIKKLNENYNQENRGIKLEYYGEKLKITTKKQHSEYYKRLIGEDSKNPLSPSALETLAIIAYNEPITRITVDEIRGVNSAHIIRKLVFKNLVQEVGRSELPGKPRLYGVTPQFLDYFGLKTTKELPDIKIEEENEPKNLFDTKYKEEK